MFRVTAGGSGGTDSAPACRHVPLGSPPSPCCGFPASIGVVALIGPLVLNESKENTSKYCTVLVAWQLHRTTNSAVVLQKRSEEAQ